MTRVYKNLTRKQLAKQLQRFEFIAARWSDGVVTGVNSRVALLGLKRFPLDDTETRIMGFRPIGFQEYIRIKIPFYRK
jgi:hypothetical protein